MQKLDDQKTSANADMMDSISIGVDELFRRGPINVLPGKSL